MLADVNALLEDPTHSTERAKITGPRRRFPKKGTSSRYIVWAAGVAVVLAAVVFTVTQLVGPPTANRAAAEPGAGSAELAIVPPVDAAVAPPPVDAPPVPEAEMLEVAFESTPAGATVFLDNFEKGVTPFKAGVVKRSKDITLTGYLDGYNEYRLDFNPLELLEEAPDGEVHADQDAQGRARGQAPDGQG